MEARWKAVHEAAVAAGRAGYDDPDTGLFVMSALALGARQGCCGSGCRHCPYDAAAQAKAGRRAR